MEIWQVYRRVCGILSPATKSRLRATLPQFRQRIRGAKTGASIDVAAQSIVEHTFPDENGHQKQFMAFYLAAIQQASEGGKDSLSELGEEQQLRLQAELERLAKAKQVLSNLLKKYSETASAIIQNLK